MSSEETYYERLTAFSRVSSNLSKDFSLDHSVEGAGVWVSVAEDLLRSEAIGGNIRLEL